MSQDLHARPGRWSRAARPTVVALAALAALALAACGDDAPTGPDAGADAPGLDILDRLRALPEVVSVDEAATGQPGYRYFLIQFDQPVDHDAPDGPHFQQFATLIHTDETRPMVLVHTGYANWYYDNPTELTRLLHANQIVVEHRFFRGSRPAGGPGDWQYLTIAQSAADHHRIVTALAGIYGAPWLETGASKGGMTSIYHRRFYPDDVDGTVAYVAPISYDAPDYRYDSFLDGVGPMACRDAVRALQVELLTNRRSYLEARAQTQAQQDGWQYTRVSLPAAVESAAVSLEWVFWQYAGVSACGAVPPTSASDATMWEFLDAISPVSDLADVWIGEFEAYYYQAETELGYPGTVDDHLAGLLQFGDADYAGIDPVGVTLPAHDPAVMADIDTWVESAGQRLIFVYGEWDPWSGGAFTLGGATDSQLWYAPRATHGANIARLVAGERDQVLDRLAAWSGVTPDRGAVGARLAPAPRWPHPPPVLARRARR